MAISDQVAIQIVTGVVSLLGTVFTGVMAYLMAKLNKKADAAAIETEVVKTELVKTQNITEDKLNKIVDVSSQAQEQAKKIANTAMVAAQVAKVKTNQLIQGGCGRSDKIDELIQTSDKIHTLVNSSMAKQLELNVRVSELLAEITKQPADIEAVQVAKDLLDEHNRRQAHVDQQASADSVIDKEKP